MRDLRVIKKRDCYVVMDYSNNRRKTVGTNFNKSEAENYRHHLLAREITESDLEKYFQMKKIIEKYR